MIVTAATQAQTPQAATQHRKLVDAAQQFEAVFLNEMLKDAHFFSSPANDGSSSQSGTMQSLGTESLSKAISAQGGFGIARHIVADIEHEHARRETTTNLSTSLKSSSTTPISAL